MTLEGVVVWTSSVELVFDQYFVYFLQVTETRDTVRRAVDCERKRAPPLGCAGEEVDPVPRHGKRKMIRL